ncbi:hypothetical protein CHS0354_027289 [Potamilus streckersoni]|uniref:Uncharacterized protein n=1 Tax=Potamilus streckersoni TaxID=2493646 RepID=A0AAE0W926_9BIVA|nr:hypothetical protein CHS0354_027289 [Potamilus streckersoni]
MRFHPCKLFSCLRFVLLLGGLVLVWLLNSTWNWETILVAIKIGSNHFPSEGGHKYQMRQGININYHQIWEKCNQAINGESIFIPTTDVEEIIDALRSAKIVKADIYSPSTSSEYKWILILEGGQLVHFKPALINKTVKESGNCFSGCGHAEYEVAGFTLNRILQLGNMPYATGRLISWNKEIKSVATKALRSSVTIRGALHPSCLVTEHFVIVLERWNRTKQILFHSDTFWTWLP